MADPQLEVLAAEECWRRARRPPPRPAGPGRRGHRTGWSVVVRGALAEVTDPGDLERLRALPLYPWAPGDKARYVRVQPVSVTGRRIRIPDDLPFTWWG
jgi:uncharacterized protein